MLGSARFDSLRLRPSAFTALGAGAYKIAIQPASEEKPGR